MPKPINFTYEKKEAFRDAFFLIIICEGTNREIDYFRFFEGMSSRVQLVPVASDAGSAPKFLVDCAIDKEKELDTDHNRDRVWFVIDTDRWRDQLRVINDEAADRPHWNIAQSNPCFEVWLYFHAKSTLPEIPAINACNHWKPLLPAVIQGGFNSDMHPIAIEVATANSKANFAATGYFPQPGSTAVWKLGEELLHIIKKGLDILKPKFPAPVLV